MNKKTLRIAAVVACCFCALFALCGCDALGVSITERGIRAENGNVLLIGIIVIIVLVVFIQRFFER